MPDAHRRAFDAPATIVEVPDFEPFAVRHLMTMLPEYSPPEGLLRAALQVQETARLLGGGGNNNHNNRSSSSGGGGGGAAARSNQSDQCEAQLWASVRAARRTLQEELADACDDARDDACQGGEERKKEEETYIGSHGRGTGASSALRDGASGDSADAPMKKVSILSATFCLLLNRGANATSR